MPQCSLQIYGLASRFLRESVQSIRDNADKSPSCGGGRREFNVVAAFLAGTFQKFLFFALLFILVSSLLMFPMHPIASFLNRVNRIFANKCGKVKKQEVGRAKSAIYIDPASKLRIRFQSPIYRHAISRNKLALVTGASRGIGRAIALKLAQDGNFVIVNSGTGRLRRSKPWRKSNKLRSGRVMPV